MDSDYVIYILKHSKNNCTYVGITNNPDRRIQQHNGIKSGGARYTKMKKEDGEWIYYGFIPSCTKSEALSIEKKIHIHSKKYKGLSPLEKRIACTNHILKDYNHLFLVIL